MRSQFDISHLKKELVDHSSVLVCISRLTYMAGQGELTVFPKKEFLSSRTSVSPLLIQSSQKFNYAELPNNLFSTSESTDGLLIISLFCFFFSSRDKRFLNKLN